MRVDNEGYIDFYKNNEEVFYTRKWKKVTRKKCLKNKIK